MSEEPSYVNSFKSLGTPMEVLERIKFPWGCKVERDSDGNDVLIAMSPDEYAESYKKIIGVELSSEDRLNVSCAYVGTGNCSNESCGGSCTWHADGNRNFCSCS